MARVIAALLGLLIPASALAQIVIPPCPVGGMLPCAGGGSLGLSTYLGSIIFPAIRAGFVALGFVMFTVYAARLLLEPEEESTVTEIKNAYSQAAIGATIISVSTLIVDSFGRSANNTIVNPAGVLFAVNNVIGYLKLVVGVSISALILLQSIRLISLQGDEGEISQQRTKFFHSLLGVAAILLANTLLSAVQPGNNSITLNNEIRGAINFGLEILMVLAVIGLIVAGVMLIVSVDESLKDRAKKIIFGTVVALLVVISAFTIVNYFLLL